MQYVRIHRAASVQEGNDLQHYTEMLVRKFNDIYYNKLYSEAELLLKTSYHFVGKHGNKENFDLG